VSEGSYNHRRRRYFYRKISQVRPLAENLYYGPPSSPSFILIFWLKNNCFVRLILKPKRQRTAHEPEHDENYYYEGENFAESHHKNLRTILWKI